MKRRNIFYALLLMMMASACSKDDIMTFDLEESGVYFQYGWQTRFYMNIDAYMDSIDYSFSTANEEVTDTVLATRVRTMGKVRDYDRPFTVVVDKEQTTAVEGTHYAIDYSKAVIPAGKGEVEFPVRFFRTPDLMNEKLTLVLKLEDNEHFKVYFDEQKNTNIYNSVGEQIKTRYFIFKVSEIYTKPGYWTLCGDDTLGEWSITKLRLVNRLFGISAADWNNGGGSGSKVQSGYFVQWAFKLRQYLQDAADSGVPVMDDNGSYMQLAPGYEVDYSAYSIK